MSDHTLSSFKGILWSRKFDSLDLEGDKTYIVHQVLSYGNMNQVKELFDLYSKEEVGRVFSTFPKKNYTPPAFNFVKNCLLNLEKVKVKSENYVKSIF